MPKRMAGMSPEAEAQFLKGIAYIAERNPSAAEKIVAKLRGLRETLADFPKSGVRREIPGTRRMVLKPFVLTVRLGKTVWRSQPCATEVGKMHTHLRAYRGQPRRGRDSVGPQEITRCFNKCRRRTPSAASPA